MRKFTDWDLEEFEILLSIFAQRLDEIKQDLVALRKLLGGG